MFIIDFRVTNNTQYRFSVIGNANVDKVHLFSRFVEYASDCSIYLKVRSNDDRYVDKIAIASEDVSVVDGALVCKWTMGAVSTQCKELLLQLQFEKEDGEIIAQSQIVKLTLADTINVDELIPVIYPQVLKELKDRIEDLEAESFAGVSMSYANDTLSMVFKNKDNETLTSVQVEIKTSDKLPIVPRTTKLVDLPSTFVVESGYNFYLGHVYHIAGTQYQLNLLGYGVKGAKAFTSTSGDTLETILLYNQISFSTFALENNTLLIKNSDGSERLSVLYNEVGNKPFILKRTDLNAYYSCNINQYEQGKYEIEIESLLDKTRYYYKDSENYKTLANIMSSDYQQDYLLHNEAINIKYVQATDLLTSLAGNPIVFEIRGSFDYYLCYVQKTAGNPIKFEIENMLNGDRWVGETTDETLTIYSVISGNTYKQNYEVMTNKVTSISESSTDTQYPTAKCVYDVISAIKNDSYKPVDTTTYPTLNDFLASTGEEGYMYLYPIDTSDLTKGYYRYIWENGTWVDLGTTQIDLSGYYAKNQSLIPNTTNTYDLGSSTYTFKDLYLGGQVNFGANSLIKNDTGDVLYVYGYSKIVFNTNGGSIQFNRNIDFSSDNSKDIGSSSHRAKHLYLSNNLSDGTNAFTIAHAYKILDGVTNSTALSFETILEASVSADTSYTFPVVSAGTQPEAKAIITNSGASTITLTFENVSKCLCNDDNAVITSTENTLTHIWTTTITIGAGVTYEISIVASKMVVVNFEAQ